MFLSVIYFRVHCCILLWFIKCERLRSHACFIRRCCAGVVQTGTRHARSRTALARGRPLAARDIPPAAAKGKSRGRSPSHRRRSASRPRRARAPLSPPVMPHSPPRGLDARIDTDLDTLARMDVDDGNVRASALANPERERDSSRGVNWRDDRESRHLTASAKSKGFSGFCFGTFVFRKI